MNIEEIRKDFPVTKNLIYLDHAAVAPIHLKSKLALEEYTNHFINYGIRNYEYWHNKTEKIREDFAKFIGSKSAEIAFIKNTSAGISLLANGINFKKGENIIIPNIEFPANVYPWLGLKKKGVETRFLNCENGTVCLNKLEELTDKNTRVISVSWVEFTNGYRNDLKAISEICRKKSEEFGRKIYFCVDGIQGLGALNINVKELGIDFFAADGHKWFLAAEGAGFLYCSEEIIDEVYPGSLGWKSVVNPLDFTNINFELEKSAKKFEEGSMNIPGIVTLGASLELFNEVGIQNIEKRILSLSDYTYSSLKNENIEIATVEEKKFRSGIVSFKTQDIKKDFKKVLENDIQISKRGNLLRISPHFYNTEAEIDKFIEVLKN